jgi:simple sugar transport system permease protein
MRERLASLGRSHEARLAAIVVAIAAYFAVAAPGFLTLANLMDLLDGRAVLAILAAGLLVVLIAGGIDISCAAIAAVSQYLVALCLIRWSGNWALALLLAAGFGAALGAVNALLIHMLKAPPVIVTIATMTFYFSMLIFLTNGVPLYDLPDWFTVKVSILGIPLPVAMAGAVLGATAFLLRRLSLGRQIFGLGGNPEAARRMGCNVAGLQGFIYGFSGAMAGLAGLVQAYRVEEVAPSALIGRELDVLAAVVLGGASLTGGRGTVGGTVLGIVLLAMLHNGLTLMGVSSYAFGFVTGLLILLSLGATSVSQRRPRKGGRHAG